MILSSEKYIKKCKYLNYVEHLLILASTVTTCTLSSAFPSLVATPVDITSFAVGIKIRAITAGIKKYKLIMKKKKKKHDKIMLLQKDMLIALFTILFIIKSRTNFVNNMASSANKYKSKQITY